MLGAVSSEPTSPPPSANPRVFRGKVVRHGKRPSEHADFRIRWGRRWRNFRRLVVGWLISAAVFVLLRLPRFMLRGLASLTIWIARGRLSRIADKNLERVFGPTHSEAERNEIRDRMFERMKPLVVDWICYPRQGPAFFAEHVDDADALAKFEQFERDWLGGYLIVSGHVGNWELLGQWMGLRTSRGWGGSVAKRQPNPRLNRVIEDLRGRHGMSTLYRDDPPTKIVRLLRGGHGVGLVPDQATENVGGVFIDFLGHKAYTPIGPARLSVTCKVPILMLMMKQTDTGYRLLFDHVLWPDDDLPRDEAILAMTKRWSGIIEGWIRDDPDQWQWCHDRWKLTPEALARKNRTEISSTASAAQPAD